VIVDDDPLTLCRVADTLSREAIIPSSIAHVKTVVQRSPAEGPGNEGRGEFIQFLDSDDLPLAGKVFRQGCYPGQRAGPEV